MASKAALVGVTEARQRLREFLEDIEDRDVLILRRNRPVAVIVHPERLERLVSKVEDLEDYTAALEARIAEEEGIPHEEVVARFKLDRPAATA